MKRIAYFLLKISVKIALKRNGYKVVAITGSAGKTSTRKAVVLVLKKKYRVLSSADEGYNTELGVPFTLLEKTVPKSKVKLFFIILLSPIMALKKKNYDFCVLEMGADKPGDIAYFMSFIRPDISVVTSILPSHLDKFETVQNIQKEKGQILSRLREGGTAVINLDNEYVSKMQVPDGVKVFYFGQKSDGVTILDQEISNAGSINRFRISGKDAEVQSRAFGEHILYVFGAAIGVGLSQGLAEKEITSALEDFMPVRGRLNVIKGLNGATIIDDSYNANPTSMKNALDVLAKVEGSRKIAVLGDMNGLGDSSIQAHKKIGVYLAGKCDILVTVGELSRKHMVEGAVLSGLKKENVISFDDSREAGLYFKDKIQKGDIILVKGSQNKIRMERFVKEVMAEPKKAEDTLCRQSQTWEGKV